MEYLVDQFVLFEFDNTVGIQNSTGFTIIKDTRIINFFREIDQDNRRSIHDYQMKDFFEDEQEEIISFLVDNNLITVVPTKKNYDEIFFITNNPVVHDVIEYIQVGSYLPIVSNKIIPTREILGFIQQSPISKKVLVIISLIPFDYNTFLQLNDYLHKNNFMYVFSFSYNSKIYITNIHKRDWYNPCPKCFFSQLEASLRAYNRNTSEMTFQSIVDLVYSKKISFNPDLPLTNRNILNFMFNLFTFDTKEEDINNLANRIIELNLYSTTVYDQAVHWELCDCFE